MQVQEEDQDVPQPICPTYMQQHKDKWVSLDRGQVMLLFRDPQHPHNPDPDRVCLHLEDNVELEEYRDNKV
jgi:hypothetical protein